MIAELGQFMLALALTLALAQSVLGWRAAGDAYYRTLMIRMVYAQAGLISTAFLFLIILFLQSDFSVALVATHSHSTKPWFYQIAASWGNHEGSLLLWVLFLALAAALLAFFLKREAQIKFAALAVQAGITSLFLAFLIFTSNPFMRLVAAPFQGAGLNPILQDPALVIHPPILYVGYVGFSIAFSLAVAALWARRVDQQWAQLLLLPVKLSWAALTIGIALGSWWAYRELGWGGFWFWDPVENAALMPWLVATALFHAVIIAARRALVLNWVLLLAIASFLFSILGTFLTRSGVITSVHSFASDPTRGLVMLAILTLLILSVAILFIARPPVQAPQKIAIASREAAIMANSLFLSAAVIAVLTGTIYPLLLEAATAQKIAAGPPYFNATFVPIMIPLLLLMPIAPFLGGAGAKIAIYLTPAALAAAFAFFLWQPQMSFAALGFAIAIWLIAGALTRAWVRWKNLRGELGMIIAHGGMGVLLAGMIGTGTAQLEQTHAFSPGEEIYFAGYQIRFEKTSTIQTADYRSEQAQLLVYHGDQIKTKLKPEIRHYIARPQPTREADIYTSLLPLADLHAILGDEVGEKRTVKFYYNPLAPLLWVGAGLMALAAVFSLWRRR